MKYIMWECANFRNPKLAQALKDESYSVGKNIYFTMHEVVGQFFDYGTWWNQGYTGLPYEFDTSLADFMHDCKLKDEEEVIRILEKFRKYELTDFHLDKDMGLLKLVCPELMKMMDRGQKESDTWTKKVPEEVKQYHKNYWINKGIGNGVYFHSTEPVLQIIEQDKKESNPKKSNPKQSNPIQTQTSTEESMTVQESLDRIARENQKRKSLSNDDDVPF